MRAGELRDDLLVAAPGAGDRRGRDRRDVSVDHQLLLGLRRLGLLGHRPYPRSRSQPAIACFDAVFRAVDPRVSSMWRTRPRGCGEARHASERSRSTSRARSSRERTPRARARARRRRADERAAGWRRRRQRSRDLRGGSARSMRGASRPRSAVTRFTHAMRAARSSALMPSHWVTMLRLGPHVFRRRRRARPRPSERSDGACPRRRACVDLDVQVAARAHPTDASTCASSSSNGCCVGNGVQPGERPSGSDDCRSCSEHVRQASSLRVAGFAGSVSRGRVARARPRCTQRAHTPKQPRNEVRSHIGARPPTSRSRQANALSHGPEDVLFLHPVALGAVAQDQAVPQDGHHQRLDVLDVGRRVPRSAARALAARTRACEPRGPAPKRT